MALFQITDKPIQLTQPAHPASLIVNVGDSICYLDSQSTVSIHQYSLELAPGQSVNYSGGQNIWVVCPLGESTKLTLLANGDTTITPIRSVKIDGNVELAGPVAIDGTVQVAGNVGISGGTINVGTIDGDVSVDGSTVNIGNNVRLWGGGEWAGEYNTVIPAFGVNSVSIATAFPDLVHQKYNSLRLKITLTSGGGGQGMHTCSIWSGNGVRDGLVSLLATNSSNVFLLGDTGTACLEFPLMQTPDASIPAADNHLLEIRNGRNVTASFYVDAWGSYAPLTQPRIVPLSRFSFDAGIYADLPPGNITQYVHFILPCCSEEREVSIIPNGGLVAGNIVVYRMQPTATGLSFVRVKNVAASLASGVTATVNIPASPFINALSVVANPGNTATSYTITVSQ